MRLLRQGPSLNAFEPKPKGIASRQRPEYCPACCR